MDFHSRGAQLKRMLSGDAQEMVASLLQSLSVALGVQQGGTVVSDQHRILNFQGLGVTVADDAAARRTNIIIPGSAVASSTTTIISDAVSGVKAQTLWNGSSNNAPPTNWNLPSYSDAAWSAAVISGQQSVMHYVGIASTNIIWAENPGLSITEQALHRHSFTLPAGTISGVSLQLAADGPCSGVWINGTSLSAPTNTTASWGPSGPTGVWTLAISPSLLNAGASNLLAVWSANENPSSGDTPSYYGSVSYKLTVTYSAGAGTFQNALTADVTCTNANQYYDGPAVTVPAGTWRLSGTLTLYNTASGHSSWTIKLWDGTTPVASCEQTQVDNLSVVALSVSWVVSPSATTTYKISAACTVAGGKILSGAGATPISNNAGNTASTLAASGA